MHLQVFIRLVLLSGDLSEDLLDIGVGKLVFKIETLDAFVEVQHYCVVPTLGIQHLLIFVRLDEANFFEFVVLCLVVREIGVFL